MGNIKTVKTVLATLLLLSSFCRHSQTIAELMIEEFSPLLPACLSDRIVIFFILYRL